MWCGVFVLSMLICSSLFGVSVSECMRSNQFYRCAMLVLMFGQFWRWWGFIDLFQQRNFTSACFAKMFLFLACESWACLCADLHSHMHGVWTFMFGASFSLMAFSLYPLIQSDNSLTVMWWRGFWGLFVSILSCLALLVQNSKHTGTAEHIAFIVYNITFWGFFSSSR